METAPNARAISEADLEFHYLIAQATQNPLIIKVFEILHDNYLSLLSDNVAVLGARGASDHHGIVTAIEIRDTEGAKELMKKHLDNTIRRFALENSKQ